MFRGALYPPCAYLLEKLTRRLLFPPFHLSLPLCTKNIYRQFNVVCLSEVRIRAFLLTCEEIIEGVWNNQFHSWK